MCLLGGSPRLKHGSRLHCEIANMPPKRCRHGKAAAKAKAKAVAKAVAKAKMLAKAQAKAKAELGSAGLTRGGSIGGERSQS